MMCARRITAAIYQALTRNEKAAKLPLIGLGFGSSAIHSLS